MTVCAVMLVKDEADIVGYTVDHLLGQVDQIIVSDNDSTDDTFEIVAAKQEQNPDQIVLLRDDEVGYWQDRKTTALAQMALRAGHQWVLPCDADEFWYAPDRRPISSYLDGVAPDVRIVSGDLFNHIPSALDPDGEPNPFLRIGWRQKSHGAMGKVCCRLTPDLWIRMGNHSASFDGRGLTVPGLVLRHYSWRSEEQYVRKIRNGERAYAATTMPDTIGAHWRMFANAEEQAIRDHFNRWFFTENPGEDPSLIFDPAPIKKRKRKSK